MNDKYEINADVKYHHAQERISTIFIKFMFQENCTKFNNLSRTFKPFMIILIMV